MKNENFNIPASKSRILISPLDWGLGHATRCIPIISTLIKQNCTVFVAAEGRLKILLQNEFPDLQCIELRGYRVKYSRYKFWMPIKLLIQFPKIIFRIYAENHWLKKIVRDNNIDAVISDNRMGLYHKKIPCVYITHQLSIKTGNSFTEGIAQKIHYHFINKFSACWVPDAKGELNLAGELSHPVKLPKTPVTYLGILSRFEPKKMGAKYDICIILSGPDAQRNIFEKIILKDLLNVQGKIILVRGLPGVAAFQKQPNTSVEIKNHLPSGELNEIILQSKLVVCRSGYSSVMDLAKLQKKAILVPTPAQTEQEYLATYLHAQTLFFCVQQSNFSLPESIRKAGTFEFKKPGLSIGDYKNIIVNFVAGLGTNSADI
jgi:uncharacterized protein (TIGR00661 family)